MIRLQVANAQAAGAAAALVFDNQINDYFLMLADNASSTAISIPGMSVPRRVGQLLVSSTQVGTRAACLRRLLTHHCCVSTF